MFEQPVLKVVSIDKWKGSKGLYASYYKINPKFGVKIVTQRHNGIGTLSEAIRREAKFLKHLNQLLPGLFPKFHGLVRVKRYDGTYLGILMEHINGKTMRQLGVIEVWSDLPSNLQGQFKAKYHALIKHFDWPDCHEDNVMVDTKGNIRFVDADPYFFH